MVDTKLKEKVETTYCQAFQNEECNKCELETKLNCKWERKLLWQFYSVFTPYLLISTAGLIIFRFWTGKNIYPIIYTAFLVTYFLIVRLKVFCSHCPYYEQKKFIEPLLKIWKYQSKPMNLFEKIINFSGHFFFILYPVTIQSYGIWFLLTKMSVLKNYQLILSSVFLVLSIISAITYVIGLASKLCTRCVNLHCPQNRVPKNLIKLYTARFLRKTTDKN